jgi:hypothetical protein
MNSSSKHQALVDELANDLALDQLREVYKGLLLIFLEGGIREDSTNCRIECAKAYDKCIKDGGGALGCKKKLDDCSNACDS